MIRDNAKILAGLAYKKLVKDSFNFTIRERQDNDKFSFSIKPTSGSIIDAVQELRLRLIVPVRYKTFSFRYTYPISPRKFATILEEIYFEWAVLGGLSTEEAMQQLYSMSREEIEILKSLDKLPDMPIESLEIREGIRALIDTIQEDHNLTRFQARHVFAHVFPSGVPFTVRDGELVDAAVAKVRAQMTDDWISEVSKLEPPFEGRPHAPTNVRSNTPAALERRLSRQETPSDVTEE